MENFIGPFGSALSEDAGDAGGASVHSFTPTATRTATPSATPSATRYRFSTAVGMFCIELRRTGLWRVLFGRRELGAFPSPQTALHVLLESETAWPGGPRNSSLGLPTDLEEWAPSRKAPR